MDLGNKLTSLRLRGHGLFLGVSVFRDPPNGGFSIWFLFDTIKQEGILKQRHTHLVGFCRCAAELGGSPIATLQISFCVRLFDVPAAFF